MAHSCNIDARFKVPSLPFEMAQTKRICYNCKNSYPHAVRFCPQDGADLDYITPPIEALARDFAPQLNRKLLYFYIVVISVLLFVFLRSGSFHPGSGGLRSGEIAIRTNPSGAVIYLDGYEVGVTPVLLSEVPTGVHFLRAEFPGYRNEGARIEILPRSKKQLELQLAPLTIKHMNPFVATIIPLPGRY
jgi:hypothetical protein